MEVKVEGDNVAKAIKVFKRKLQRDGFFRELKRKRYYEKPSARRKRKAAEARRRRLKKMRRQQLG